MKMSYWMLIRIREGQYTPSVHLSPSLECFHFFPLVSVVLASFPGFLDSVGVHLPRDNCPDRVRSLYR